jgi:hypothetical protein
MSSPAPAAALAEYYIADGVHRAVAARENGLARVPAKRAMVPPIEVQPLGAPGQTASIPLAQVTIVN